MSRQGWRIAAAGIGLAALASCQTGGPAPAGLSSPISPLVWGHCGKGVPASFQCATLKVPLDYAKPEGPALGLALIRLPATEPKKRLGSLVFNFGGPGGSGVSTLIDASSAFTALGARYDLVSFDPRGVERSSGVRCLSDADMDRYLTKEPSGDVAVETQLITSFNQGCQKNSAQVLPYVGTVNAARDMETMREALGDPRLNFLGFSYGTHLGAVYATLHPERTGRMVLDSALDPSVSQMSMARTQVLGFQRAYENYLDACVAQQGGCPLGKDLATARATVLKLFATLESRPATANGRQVTEDVARTGVVQALYSEQLWPLLTEALVDGARGDLSGLQQLADQYAERDDNGHYSTLLSSLQAIMCADTTDRPTIAEADALADKLAKRSPIFAPNAVSAGSCSGWPVPGEDTNRHIDATGSGPIVVVGVTHDPATPYQWSPKLAAQLRTAVLVTLKGEGHGAYGRSACVDNAVNDYLLKGETPEQGLVCD